MSEPEPIIDFEGYSLKRAEERVLALELLLNQYGIELRTGTALEAVALNAFDVLYQKNAEKPDERADVRIPLKHLIGLNELASLILGVKDHAEFHKLIPHLRLLNEGDSIQNMPSSALDQATNKVFELFAAVLALHCGTDLEMDTENSNGRNPDVLITIGGRRWGIACKALHSKHPQGFAEHLEKAIDQIEKSPAEVGVVLFSIKNILDQSRYWSVTNPDEVIAGALPSFSAFVDARRPFEILIDDSRSLGQALSNHVPAEHLASMFHDKKALPGFLIWAHVVTAIVGGNAPIPTSVRVMSWQHVLPISSSDRATLEQLHQAAYVADHT